MSSGPTLTGETCIQALKKQYERIDFDKADWCTYKGLCDIGILLTNIVDPCIICKYRKPLNIPKIIKLKKQYNKKMKVQE